MPESGKVLKTKKKAEVFKGRQESAILKTCGQNWNNLSNNRNNVVLNYDSRYK